MRENRKQKINKENKHPDGGCSHSILNLLALTHKHPRNLYSATTLRSTKQLVWRVWVSWPPVIIAPWRKSSNPLIEARFALVADKSSTWYKTRRKVTELVHRSRVAALYQRCCCCHFSLYFNFSSHIQLHSHLAFPVEFDWSNFIRVFLIGR